MAHITTSAKMNGDDEQFYFQAGGYVLLRITRTPGVDSFSIMTATASEKVAHRPARKPRPKLEIFTKADGSTLRGKSKTDQAPSAKAPLAYPDTDRLIAAVASVIAIDETDMEEDHCGRPYVKIRGVTSAMAVRDFGNQIARILGLETRNVPWSFEEIQTVHEEFSVSGTGEDVYLNKDMNVNSFGDVVEP
ncbi:hypothetical protein ACGYLO_11340 [Sulfitobacter sp. 1A13353]|uniref:hypothetical protein n=1 Tax=Sulfitobacter sp. 1A13353 TaxID=3368568 RepID=UPI0037460D80